MVRYRYIISYLSIWYCLTVWYRQITSTHNKHQFLFGDIATIVSNKLNYKKNWLLLMCKFGLHQCKPDKSQPRWNLASLTNTFISKISADSIKSSVKVNQGIISIHYICGPYFLIQLGLFDLKDLLDLYDLLKLYSLIHMTCTIFRICKNKNCYNCQVCHHKAQTYCTKSPNP
jgi:hypothetical protein